MKPVAIIIPVYNAINDLRMAVDSIFQTTNYPFKMLLIESESTDGTAELCDELAKQYDQIEVFHTKREAPVQKAINFGIKKAGDMDIYLTHTDTVHYKFGGYDWLDQVVKESKRDKCGAVIPINGGGISGPTFLNQFKWAGTWAFFIKRETINEIGLYDEQMNCGDDIDYTYRIVKSGKNISIINKFFMDHHHRGREDKDNEIGKLMEANGIYFKLKHELVFKPVTIGIPLYNDLHNFKEAVDSLINSTGFPFNLLIVESESTDGSAEYADLLPKLYPSKNIEVIHTKKEGPLKAYEKIFSLAIERNTDLYLTQSDTVHRKMRDDWLYHMYKISQYEDCGGVTCKGGGGVSGPEFIEGFEWTGAWSFYLPISTLKKVGIYDEKIPLGWGVDIDYSYRIKKLGLLIYEMNYFVEHYPNYEDSHEHEKVDNFEQLKKEAFEYMRKKHKIESSVT